MEFHRFFVRHLLFAIVRLDPNHHSQDGRGGRFKFMFVSQEVVFTPRTAHPIIKNFDTR